MNWTLNSASIIGRDHELSKKNRQDFFHSYVSDDRIIGTVCDGCGESKYSEFGASLMGVMLVNFLRFCENFNEIGKLLEKEFDYCFKTLQNILYFEVTTEQEKISFTKEFLLSTNLFCILVKNKIIIGNCGDGVIIVNKNIVTIDQDGKPEYIAYKSIPKEALETQPSSLNFFNIQTYDQFDVDSIVIATDGIQPIIDNNMFEQIYGTKKRQLQRKFNVWQNEGFFADDATCIVIEKQNAEQNNNLQ